MIPNITQGKIFRFWLPLLGTWLLMAIELPALNALITHLSNIEINLAAFGIGYAIFLLAEAPIIMLNMVAIKLLKDQTSYRQLKKFADGMTLIITILMLIVIATPLFQLITLNALKLPPEVVRLSHHVLLILLPAYIAIGIRRFYQGVLMSRHLTKFIGVAILIRVVSTLLVAFLLFTFSKLEGAIMAAISLVIGIIIEAICTRLLTITPLKHLPQNVSTSINFRQIFNFYYPLAITGIVSLAITPIVTLFLARAPDALISLAIFPVINALITIFKSIAMSYQEVVAALMNHQPQHHILLRRVAFEIGIIVAVILIILAFTPIAHVYLQSINNLSDSLFKLALLPMQILSLYPILTLMIIWERGLLIGKAHTSIFSLSAIIEILVVAILLFILCIILNMSGLLASSIALCAGRIAGYIILKSATYKVFR